MMYSAHDYELTKFNELLFLSHVKYTTYQGVFDENFAKIIVLLSSDIFPDAYLIHLLWE